MSQNLIAPATAKADSNQPPPRFTSIEPRKMKQNRWDAIDRHVPTTDILTQIKRATNNKKILQEVEITPAMAMDILTLNDPTQNRDLTESTIETYSQDMIEGNWDYAGGSLLFSFNSRNEEIRLIDGQHRLFAIIQSGKKQVFNIVTGLHPERFSQIDIGKNRTGADVLKIAKYGTYSGALAYAIKIIILFDKYSRVLGSINEKKVTNQSIRNWTKNKERMEQLLEHMEYARLNLHKKGPFFTIAQWASVRYILSNLPNCHKRGPAFCDLLAHGTGDNMHSNHPAYVARELMLAMDRAMKKGKREKGPLTRKFKYVMRAWNMWLKKESCKGGKMEINDKTLDIEKPKWAA